MDKAHDVRNVTISGSTLRMQVDGHDYEINVSEHSEALRRATKEQRERFEVGPAGYGIHWPEIDEDLSIDGLIGTTHPRPAARATA